MIELNKIYNEDCLATLSKLPDESIDLVFADPPFNVNIKYNGYKDDIDNYYEWQRKWIVECFRVLKPTGSFYLMTITRHLPETLYEMQKHGIMVNLIKWRNVAAVNNKKSFWNNDQPIAFFAKTENYKFNHLAETRESAWTRFGGYSTEKKGQLLDWWDDIPFVYVGSIKHKEAIMKPKTNSKAHPAQMPEHLPGRAIKFSTDENDIVYDPFMGSGTTARAAIKLNRNYIGSEISEDYFKLSTNVIEQQTHASLF